MVEVATHGRAQGGAVSFSEIFNPGMKHLHEEQQRKRIEAQIPESEGDPLRDFEHGIIRITPKDAPSEPIHRPDADAADAADADAPGADNQTGD